MPPGKLFLLLGLGLVVLGIFLTFGGRIPWLGRLPGDIRIDRENFSFFFPFTTCILISLLLSLLFWFFRR